MHYRSLAACIFYVAIGTTGLAAVSGLEAQDRINAEPGSVRLSATSLLTALSNYRAVRWASAARVIHCSPAPLTERPGVQAEFARPHVAPLDEAFADAQSVKRAIEYRARSVAMEKR
jgi:hypothetical protein